ncbi:MAG: winged helix DNA-binding protein [Bacteroidetes bacterium]|nr:winged helix DNA-binding protein [Bacteroidota bacterium]
MPLLSKWEEYLNQFPEGDITGFARWVLATSATTPAESPAPGHTSPAPGHTSTAPGHTSPASGHTSPPIEEQSAPEPATNLDSTAQSLLLISRLHRIVQFRSKPIVKYLGFTKPQEFSILVQTAIMNNPNKKQLCHELLIEGSTGVEITRRLTAKGFLKEKPDVNDRRSALLSLTEKGKQTLLQGYTKLSPIHSEFLSTLNETERRQLVSMLARLNEYHTRHLPPLS